jgi:hypothetical protein
VNYPIAEIQVAPPPGSSPRRPAAKRAGLRFPDENDEPHVVEGFQ